MINQSPFPLHGFVAIEGMGTRYAPWEARTPDLEVNGLTL